MSQLDDHVEAYHSWTEGREYELEIKTGVRFRCDRCRKVVMFLDAELIKQVFDLGYWQSAKDGPHLCGDCLEELRKD